MKEILLIFTRDFSQWCNQMVRDLYVKRFPKIWGRGLKDQIVRYTGRTFEWYRYTDDLAKLREYIAHKALSAPIFTKKAHRNFASDVAELRKLIKFNPTKIKYPYQHYQRIHGIFSKFYPIYALGVFLPGPWREDFLRVHGKKGKKVLKLVFHSREISEGMVKLVGDYFRLWLGPMLKKRGYNSDFVKLLSADEVSEFLNNGTLPARTELQKRAKGFVHIGGKIITGLSFERLLKRKKLISKLNLIQNSGELVGSVAYPGKIVKGRVRIILNSEEAKKFIAGSILVTPMTSPEYLPAMKKAKAIITDEGGITCHAAITAREFKIPTVIGTRVATKMLKDGDLVEVDADRGMVRKLKLTSLQT